VSASKTTTDNRRHKGHVLGSRRSALDPHRVGSCWSSMSTSGHRRPMRIAGRRAFIAPTSAGEAA
jgi:hypothetical protein